MQVLNMVANVVTSPVNGAAGNAAQSSEAEQGEAGSFLQALVGLNLPSAAPQPAPKLGLPIPGIEAKEQGDNELAASEEIDPSLMLLLQAQPQPQIQPQNPPPTQAENAEPVAIAAALEGDSSLPPVTAKAYSAQVSQPALPVAADKRAADSLPATTAQNVTSITAAELLEVQSAGAPVVETPLPTRQDPAPAPQLETERSTTEEPEAMDPPSMIQEAGAKKPAPTKPETFSSLLSKFEFFAPKEVPAEARLIPSAAPAKRSAPANGLAQDKNDTTLDMAFTLAVADVKPDAGAKSESFVAPGETAPAIAGVSSDAGGTVSVANASVTHPTPADVKPAHDLSAQPHLRAHVGSAAWREELGTQMNWMVEKGQHSASIKLTPEHLGPVEVRIDVNQDQQASIWFSAQHSETRTALEQALPQLRDMLAAQGMSLTDAGVHREPPRQQTPNAAPASSLSANTSIDMSDETAPIVASRLGLLDTYA